LPNFVEKYYYLTEFIVECRKLSISATNMALHK